jgi:hypothetical protein
VAPGFGDSWISFLPSFVFTFSTNWLIVTVGRQLGQVTNYLSDVRRNPKSQIYSCNNIAHWSSQWNQFETKSFKAMVDLNHMFVLGRRGGVWYVICVSYWSSTSWNCAMAKLTVRLSQKLWLFYFLNEKCRPLSEIAQADCTSKFRICTMCLF